MSTRNIIVGVVLLLIAASIASYNLFSKDKSFTEEPEDVFCTMEALQCPDGSYVGRSGPKCEFSPCTQTDFIKGILILENEQFFLLVPSPDPEIYMEAYAIPIEIQFSNDLLSMINNEVIVYGSFTEGSLYSVKSIILSND